jgi:HSP20 family molecular chaperone IbpA
MTQQDMVKQAEKTESRTPQGVERTRSRKVFLPAADIYETQDAYVVAADMPGVASDRVDITLENDVLTIRGTCREPESGGQPVYTEYDTGDYERAFALSSRIDREKISAAMQHGVLTVTLPKVQPTRKRIEVKDR